ncbi:MAG TPA: hypothetical protein VHL09_01695, partial [Dehalococcoidia bacterium]|nr:hypothetical protein [Dehalococcoidia bacterium]
KAIENAKQFMWMQGEFTGLAHPVWSSPSGYFSPSHRKTFVQVATGRKANPRAADFETQREHMTIIAGTPDQVVERLRTIIEATRPSIMALWGNDGKVTHEDSMRCIQLLGQEVMPRVREIGRQLGLNDPWEANAPVSLEFPEPSRLKGDIDAREAVPAAD